MVAATLQFWFATRNISHSIARESSHNLSRKGACQRIFAAIIREPSKTLTSSLPVNDVVLDGVSALSRQIGVVTIPRYIVAYRFSSAAIPRPTVAIGTIFLV